MRTTATPNRRGLAGLIVAGAIAVGLSLLAAGPAQALPPGGAGPDTPGTHSSVSPGTITVGGTIRFTVTGYPAGETINVKIDDGQGYSDQTVQGAGVVYQQKIAADGSVSGSFALPSFVGPGTHWLRFLASQEFTDSQGNVGVNGFTNHSPNFTVVAASSGGSGGSGSGGSGGSGSGGSSGGSGAGGSTTVVPGSGVVTAKPDPGAAESATPSPSSTPSEDPSSTPNAVALANDDSGPSSGGGFPFLGVGIFAIVLIVGGIGLWLLLRRRPTARAGQATPE